jgi:hypothetical protein
MGLRVLVVSFMVCLMCAIGCEGDDKTQPQPNEKPAQTPPDPQTKPVESKRTPLNKKGTLLLETFSDGKRRVLVKTEICFREGQLELLMCKFQSKEHESILHGDVDGQEVHAALIAANAKPGSPVKYLEKPDKNFEVIPPTGTRIKVLL